MTTLETPRNHVTYSKVSAISMNDTLLGSSDESEGTPLIDMR
jgi:hypothetical protein